MATKKANRKTKTQTASASTHAVPPPPRAEPLPLTPFPIAAIGASAGGLPAFIELLAALPESPGLAIIFILHTDSRNANSLRDVLARKSRLPVEVAVDRAPALVNRVYIPPASSVLLLQDGHFRVEERDRSSSTLPIDACFRSLAEDQGNHAIGVVLSGTASDGALGTKAIKAEGGITFAQDEDTAQSQDMPHNAALTGATDFILPPDRIAQELVRVARQPHMTGGIGAGLVEQDLAKIFELLKVTHAVDFTHYKKSTLERRIRRRMTLHRIDAVENYVAMLRENAVEIEALYNDILIRVTGFFRDPEVFNALCGDILPKLFRDGSRTEPVRVWVPGCATGEEVYSLAICITEALRDGSFTCPVQIFGTDINEQAVDRARAGFYPADIANEVSPERLRHFFIRSDGGFRVTKALRDCCIFARQNLTKDPPFSRLDLISCRNVMIYLGTMLQRRVMSIFNYALRANGILLLGSSETIGNFGELFANVDRKHKIYMKRTAPTMASFGFDAPARRQVIERAPMDEEITAAAPNVFREADRVLLSRYSPPGVLINENMDILQFRGRTSTFLEPAPGAATLNLFKMAREGLLAELRAAIHAARKKEGSVRREGVRVVSNGNAAIVANLEVIPFKAVTGEQCFVVLFEEVPPEPKKGKAPKAKKVEPESESRQVQRLKRELDSTREYLQSIIEEQEAMNEELRSANEEIQSSNEELQSTNEELETAKEELQSSNEELTTLNEELENRNAELAEANNDLINLLASVEIPIVMLDSEMRIRRMNPGAQRTLNLIASDVGRPIRELKMTLKGDDIERMVRGVIENLEMRETQVQHKDGRWFSLRVRPYKTTENKIEGAVLVLIDTQGKKKG